MFANLTSRIAAGVIAAVTLGAAAASAQPSEVTGLKITGHAPTSVRIYIKGLERPAVRSLVKVAAVQVCDNAIRNREVAYYDGRWCVGATVDRTMGNFDRARAANRSVAMGPETLVLALR